MEKRRQEKVGIVSSNKMQKTVVVTVERQITHPLYKRVVRRSAKFLAHNEKNQCKIGDTVRIEETRPISARKRWRVVDIITRGSGVAPAEDGL